MIEGKKLLVGAVGNIRETADVQHVLDKENIDVALVARILLREPGFVLHVARDLETDIRWPNQYHRTVPPYYI